MTVEEYLKKHNMKQIELSRLSGVSPNAISKLAKGEGRFGVQTANKLAKLGMKVELKDFKDKTYYGWNTHYIVQLVD